MHSATNLNTVQVKTLRHNWGLHLGRSH